MSRRAKKIEKRVSLDPKFNSELVAHMIRVIMKDGKKTAAEKIVYGAIAKIQEAMAKDAAKFTKEEKVFTDPLEVLATAIDNMKPQVEVKTRRVGGTRRKSSTRSRGRATSSRSATTFTRWRRPTRRSPTTRGATTRAKGLPSDFS